MRIMIDISKDRYDEIMSMDWKNCRRIFDEEIRAIHDGKVLEQEPKTGYISIDDVMSVFDDFMCGEVDEDGTNTFLGMLIDKAESEE